MRRKRRAKESEILPVATSLIGKAKLGVCCPMADDHQHIVDILIAERAPHLRASPLWPVLRPLLYRMLDYAKARAMA